MSDPYSTTTSPGRPLPVGLAAEHLAQALGDLCAWSELTGRPLPMPADQIVALELRGHVVDLMTGEVFQPQDPPVIWEVAR